MTDRFTDKTCADPRDWRGAPIAVGATVIYGAGVGRSIAMVEATVEGFTKAGRVNVRPIRRAYGSSAAHGWDAREVVHVGQDRLTVVDALPDALLETDVERGADERTKREAREAARKSHRWPMKDVNAEDRERARARGWRDSELVDVYPVRNRRDCYNGPCEKCGKTFDWNSAEMCTG